MPACPGEWKIDTRKRLKQPETEKSQNGEAGQEALKDQLRSTWTAGDYGRIAEALAQRHSSSAWA